MLQGWNLEDVKSSSYKCTVYRCEAGGMLVGTEAKEAGYSTFLWSAANLVSVWCFRRSCDVHVRAARPAGRGSATGLGGQPRPQDGHYNRMRYPEHWLHRPMDRGGTEGI